MFSSEMNNKPTPSLPSTSDSFSSTKRAFGKTSDRVGQRSLTDALERISNAQAQFLNIKWLGDVIIRAKFQSLQAVGTVSFFGKEDDGNICCATICTQAAGDFVTVNIREADIQNDEIGMDLLRIGRRLRPN
jgi:secreted protein with Ig-like and vWFA domain